MRFNVLLSHLDKLHHFVEVAQHGSISKAAQALNMTQSALSHSVAALEEAYGTKLFIRQSRGVLPSKAGFHLLELSKRTFYDLRSAQEIANSPILPVQKNLRVGTHETLAIHLWPKTLYSLKKINSEASISLVSGRIDSLVETLKSGGFHFIVSVSPNPTQDLKSIPLYSGELQFFVSSKKFPEWLPKRNSKSTDIEAIRSAPILTDVHAHVEQGMPIPEALFDIGLGQSNLFEVTSFEACISLAEMGVGVAVIPDRNASLAVSQGRIRRISVTGIKRKTWGQYTTCLTHRSDLDDLYTLDIIDQIARIKQMG